MSWFSARLLGREHMGWLKTPPCAWFAVDMSIEGCWMHAVPWHCRVRRPSVHSQCCSPCCTPWEKLGGTLVVLMLSAVENCSSLRRLHGPTLCHATWCWIVPSQWLLLGDGFCILFNREELAFAFIQHWMNLKYFIFHYFPETGGICIAPRPSEEKADIIPAMAMRPFFGIFPVLMDENVSWGCDRCQEEKLLCFSALITFPMGEEQDLGGRIFLH